ncbi:hypothetical protein [Shewanella algae]|uniref:hypothetical protein n=1 Tax=Shewanella algae TaxID=38313 RepID=UPI0031F52FF7
MHQYDDKTVIPEWISQLGLSLGNGSSMCVGRVETALLKDIAACNVIVEKVETLEQFWLMEQVPYDGLQGYLFSRPKRLAEP